jgi:hypothetical protein
LRKSSQFHNFDLDEGSLFKNDRVGQILNHSYRNCYSSNNPDLRKCATLFNKIIRHLQQNTKNTIYSVSQIINRFIIENSDLNNLRRDVLISFLDLDSYIRFKRKL